MAILGMTVTLFALTALKLVEATNHGATHVVVKRLGGSANAGLGGSDVATNNYAFNGSDVVSIILEKDEELWAYSDGVVAISTLVNNL